jgi:hypothetical protein
MLARNSRLFQRIVDRVELVLQVGAEAVDHSDDRERNAASIRPYSVARLSN